MAAICSSATVLRLKRKRNEPCSDSLLISCKKKRKGCDDAYTHEFDQKCVKLAGTVRSKDSDELYSLSTLNEQSTSEAPPVSNSSAVCKGLKRICQISNEPVHLEEVGSTEAKRRLTVYDITKSSNLDQKSADSKVTCNGQVMELSANPLGKKVDLSIDNYGEDEDDYVYDIFYADSDVLVENVDDILCVESFSEDYGFLNYNHDFRERYEDDADDSNDESNWRNDYPDELDSSECSEDADDDANGQIDPVGFCAINSGLSNMCQLASDEDDDDSIGYEKSYRSYKKALAKEFKLTESSSEYNSDSCS